MIGRLAAPVLGILVLASAAVAGEPTERLRTLFDEANRILLASDSDTPLDDRVTAIRTLVNDSFDAREAAALALGREWHARTSVEREEFVRLYADLVERAYLAWIGSRARVHGDGVRITFESESVQGERATVVTMLETRGGGAMPIEYRMGRRDARWTVHDVVVDGVSLADSFRAQFQRILQGGAYADVVARLHDKASDATLVALAKARTARTATAAPPVVPQPVRVASVAPVSDAPPVESRVSPPLPAAVATIAPVSAAALEKPAVPAPAARVPSARRWFWIQVGAFRDTDAASRLVARLRKHSIAIATGGQRSDPLARVLVGPFTSRAAAAAALRELAAGGHRAFIALE